MQDELDYLRTEISNNKDKATFPGLGTSGSTALAGNTTTISSNQASAITANTAKTGITSQQASAITANEKAVSNNASAIATNTTDITANTKSTTANSSTITALVTNKLEVTLNKTGSSKQQLTCGVVERLGVYNLNFVYEDVDRNGKTIIKTGSIQLK